MLYTESIKKCINAYGFKVVEYKKFILGNKLDETKLKENIMAMRIIKVWNVIKKSTLIVFNRIKEMTTSIVAFFKREGIKKNNVLRIKVRNHKLFNTKKYYAEYMVRKVLVRCRSNC